MMPTPFQLQRIVQESTLFELAALADAIAEELRARGLADAAADLRRVSRELLVVASTRGRRAEAT